MIAEGGLPEDVFVSDPVEFLVTKVLRKSTTRAYPYDTGELYEEDCPLVLMNPKLLGNHRTDDESSHICSVYHLGYVKTSLTHRESDHYECDVPWYVTSTGLLLESRTDLNLEFFTLPKKYLRPSKRDFLSFYFDIYESNQRNKTYREITELDSNVEFSSEILPVQILESSPSASKPFIYRTLLASDNKIYLLNYPGFRVQPVPGNFLILKLAWLYPKLPTDLHVIIRKI